MRSFTWGTMGIWSLFVIIKLIWQRMPHFSIHFSSKLHWIDFHDCEMQTSQNSGSVFCSKKSGRSQQKNAGEDSPRSSHGQCRRVIETSHHRHGRRPGGNGTGSMLNAFLETVQSTISFLQSFSNSVKEMMEGFMACSSVVSDCVYIQMTMSPCDTMCKFCWIAIQDTWLMISQWEVVFRKIESPPSCTSCVEVEAVHPDVLRGNSSRWCGRWRAWTPPWTRPRHGGSQTVPQAVETSCLAVSSGF